MLLFIVLPLSLGCEPSGTGKAGADTPAPQAAATQAPAPAPAVAAPAVPQAQPAETKPADGAKKKNPFELPERTRLLQASLSGASAALAAGDKAKALNLLEDVLALNQTHLQASKLKAEILRSMGEHDKALAALEGALKESPLEPMLVEEKARILMAKGDSKGAIAALEGLLVQDLPLPGARYLRALAAAQASDKEGALSSLEDAVARGFLSIPMIEGEKLFASLKGEPRYQALMAKLKESQPVFSRSVIENLEALDGELGPPEAGPADYEEQIKRLQAAVRSRSGEDAPIETFDLDGKPFRTEDYKGKVLFVQCWGAWSDGSRRMIPELMRIQEEYKDKGVQILALNFETAAVMREREEIAEDVKAYQRDFHFEVPCAILDKTLALKLQVRSFPTLLVYGQDGKLYLRAPGFKAHRALKGMVDIMLMLGPGTAASPPEPEKK